MKQSVQVLDAIAAGCLTSRQIADRTGLGVKTVSAWLSELAQIGAIRDTGFLHFNDRGRPSHIYAPVGAGVGR